MGTDLHMYLVKEETGEIIEDLWSKGDRDYEWFDNLSGRGTRVYDFFPADPDLPYINKALLSNSPIKEHIKSTSYYDFFAISVKSFFDWYETTRPDIDAGWITMYEKWLYEKKKILPQNLLHYKESIEERGEETYFVEIEDENEKSRILYHHLINTYDWDFMKWKSIAENSCGLLSPEEYYIVYYFDN